MDRTKSFSTEGRRGIKRPFEGHMDNFEKETDPAVISRREKQIEFGKNTPEYYNYSTAVPRMSRLPSHPRTPNKYRKYSRRAWDGMVKQWRINLHCWSDFPISAQEQLALAAEGEEKLNESFTSEASGSTSTTSSVAAAFSAELGFLNSSSEKNCGGRNISISDSENELNCSSEDQNEDLNLTVKEKEHQNLADIKKSKLENVLSTSWADEVEDYYALDENEEAL